jgi:hypothetical protein
MLEVVAIYTLLGRINSKFLADTSYLSKLILLLRSHFILMRHQFREKCGCDSYPLACIAPNSKLYT